MSACIRKVDRQGYDLLRFVRRGTFVVSREGLTNRDIRPVSLRRWLTGGRLLRHCGEQSTQDETQQPSRRRRHAAKLSKTFGFTRPRVTQSVVGQSHPSVD